MRYGYFDDEQREYVITRPDTPLPWINYLGCEAYFGIISNTAGGYSFYRDARLRRLTRYRYNNAPLDMGGRYIYLRDDEPAGQQAGHLFWSPSWQPMRRAAGRVRVPPRAGLYHHPLQAGGHRGADPLFRPAGREPGDLGADPDQPAPDGRATCRFSRRSSSACGMRWTTPPTSSATTRSARWKWRMR